MNWKDYQDKAEQFFTSLGLEAETNARISGARGVHNIDVFVTFQRFGIESRWVVECKYWKTPIPKEKVLALHSIVQDVGADKGILLSESDFQAGAIKSAQETNIILTDLKTLQEIATEEIEAIRWLKARDKLEKVIDNLHSMLWREKDRRSNLYPDLWWYPSDEYYSILGSLIRFQMSIKDGKNGILPLTVFKIGKEEDTLSKTYDLDLFFNSLEQAIKTAKEYIDKNKHFGEPDEPPWVSDT